MLDAWYAENEPEIGFGNDEEVPRFVHIARATLTLEKWPMRDA